MASQPDPFEGNSEQERQWAELLARSGLQPGADGSVDFQAILGQLQQVMSQFGAQFGGLGGGVNWAIARDLARKVTAASGPDPSPLAVESAAVADAVRLAELWLDAQTTFDRPVGPAEAWSRAEWFEATFDVWQRLADPVASSLASAIADVMVQQGEHMPGLGSLDGVMRMAATSMITAQIGQSLGLMATDALGATDNSLPVRSKPGVALLPANVASFAEGLQQSDADVRLYLALRESARQRLFGSVAWLGPQLLALVEHYARDLRIDAEAIEQALEQQLGDQMTPDGLEALAKSLTGRLFSPALTSEQRAVLERLETLVALIEGWVDEVVGGATAGLMPAAAPLLEAVRRRRASGGPATQALKQLLNLELQPRQVREAAALWGALRAARGIEGRDAAWSHPDLVPTASDLDDPRGYVERGRPAGADSDEMDAALAQLLAEETGEDGPPGATDAQG